MLLGEKIISLRKSKSISQELLAENSHISLRTIQRIESGATVPRSFTVKVIAEALGVPIEQLTLSESGSSEAVLQDKDLEKLRLINLSALAVFLLPLSNIIIPWALWSTHKGSPLVNQMGRKIISFQILWTFATFLTTILMHSILNSLTKSVSIGHLPPTIFLVYTIFLVINLVFVIRSAIQLGKGKTTIYSFVPTLF
jgi:XRE family transcriptional regulator, regulator of sulfur utilization